MCNDTEANGSLLFQLMVTHDSPCLDGHFPGNPMVPGAMILAHLSSRLADEGFAVARVNRIKFFRPLRPAVPFQIEVQLGQNWTRVTFSDDSGIFAAANTILGRLS